MTMSELVPVGPGAWPEAGVGLVLCGGGARGAYQAGVIACLADQGVRIRAICGASVGALNGAVLACGEDLADGAARVLSVWDEVAAACGPAEVPAGLPAEISLPDEPEISVLAQLGQVISRLSSPVLQPGYLDQMIGRHVDIERLLNGPPLWVSVSHAADLGLPVWGWLFDVIRAPFARDGRWQSVNELDRSEIHQAILASAALPMVFPTREIGGRRHRDGGLFDNLPIGPLLADSDCRCVVVHLGQASLWNARDYPNSQILEIRPTAPLAGAGPVGWANGMVDFSPGRIEKLIGQGYGDAKRVLEPLKATLIAVRGMRMSADIARAALDELDREFPGDTPGPTRLPSRPCAG
jgi:NTE family protein